MSDATLRARQKAAEKSGDLEDQARALLERVRAGTLSRERLELAAYCGDAGARVVLPGPHRSPNGCRLCHGHPDGVLVMQIAGAGRKPWERIQCEHDLGALVRGLARWQPSAAIRAGCSAGRVAAQFFLRVPRPLIEALCAAEAWLDCPCSPCAEAAFVAADRCQRGHDGREIIWATGPGLALRGGGYWDSGIFSAAKLAGEGPVQIAVCETLIAWALS